jgi:hypothetical protein
MNDDNKAGLTFTGVLFGAAVIAGLWWVLKSVNEGSVEPKKLNGDFKWTKEAKKKAHDELLAVANSYEAKKRKSLKNIKYLPNGSATWSGHHNYIV